jgi:hypothetical protein
MPKNKMMDVICSPARDDHVNRIVECLERGFPRRPKSYWFSAFERMSRLPVVEGYPRYGYMLTANGEVVGVILLIFSQCRCADRDYVRCNISSWCVDEEYRGSAILLHLAAVKHKELTYLNISPARHTMSFIEAMGFQRISNGQALLIPFLSTPQPNVRVSTFAIDDSEAGLLSDSERQILVDHAALGCTALVCVKDGEASPFVFQHRRLFHNAIPCTQLVFCRSMDEYFRFAVSIARFLLFRSGPLFIIDANESKRGLVGLYFPERNPKYFKGPISPYIGDLTYTELAVFGP